MKKAINQPVIQPEELNDLAALAALDCLDPRDKILVENQLQSELTEFSQAVHQLPYSLPLNQPTPNLKERLFQQINNQINTQINPEQNVEFMAQRSQELNWYPHFVKGLKIAILHTDKQKRELSCFIRCEPGAKYPLHRHAGNEEILLLEGDLIIDGKTYGKGDYLFSPPESAHAPETKQGCMFFARTSIDDQYFDFFNRIALNIAKSAIGF